MKMIAPLLLLTALAGCAAQAPNPAVAARADQRLAEATKGRVPGKPQTCISLLGLQGPQQISPTTLIYRTGASRVWVNRLDPACPGVDEVNSIPVVRPLTGSQLCEGDLFTLIDRTGGFPRGGLCRFGKFTPYTRVAPKSS